VDELDDRAAERLVRVLNEDITSSDLGENVDRFIVGLQSWVDNALPLGPAQSRAFDVGDLVERGRVERRSSDVDRRRVEIEFADQGDGKSTLTLIHRGWDNREDGAEWRGNYDTGWEGVLSLFVTSF